jgi:hypothetical protein
MAVILYKTIGLIPSGKERVFLIKLPRGARNAYSKVAPGSGTFVVIQVDACLFSYNPRAKAISAAPKDGVLQNVMVFYVEPMRLTPNEVREVVIGMVTVTARTVSFYTGTQSQIVHEVSTLV